MLASEYNLDLYRILHAMKYHYPRAATMPALGFAAGSAMLVNEGLPQFVVNRMRIRWPAPNTKTVGELGMAFKAESDDTRELPPTS